MNITINKCFSLFINFIVSIIFLTQPSCAVNKKKYSPKYRTIAHKILALETEVSGTEPNYRLLDLLIDEAKRKIKPSHEYTKEDAIQVLQTIDDILVKNNFIYRETDLLFDALMPRSLDTMGFSDLTRAKVKERALARQGEQFYSSCCETDVIIYLGIGEALGLPIYAVDIPDHTFVRWYLKDGAYINWEATGAFMPTDKSIVRWKNISKKSIDKGVFLKQLNEKEVLAKAYRHRGDIWKSRAEYRKAVDEYTTAVKHHPLYVAAYNNRGLAFEQKKEDDNAIMDFNKVIELSPNYSDAYNNRGIIYVKKELLDKAISDFTRAITLKPDQNDALYNRALVWRKKGDFEKTLADLNKVIDNDPGHNNAYYNRGLVLKKKGDIKKGIEDFRKAVELDPGNSEFINSLAWIYVSEPGYVDPVKALDFATRAVELNRSPVNLDTLAAAYAENKNFKMAVKIEQEAYHLDGGTYFKEMTDVYKKEMTYLEYRKKTGLK